MRIGMKVSPLAVLRAGIPNYIHNLLSALGEVDRDNEYFLYTGRPLPVELDLPSNFRLRTVGFPSHRLQLWYQIGLPLRMKRDRLDLFHDPVYPLPFVLPVPGVITVHDLSNYTDPGVHTLRSAAAGKLFPHHLKRARRIIADSHYTASRLKEIFPRTADRIRVVHLGVSEDFRRVEDGGVLRSVAERYGLPSRFMLFLGTLEPRKNLERLLAAFAACAGEIPHSLVVAGGLGWKYDKLLHLISSHPVADRVRMTGFVRAEDLPAMLSMAEFLVYPSLLEGFGLPILEAMACGTPVLTSDTSSMPEIAGGAAYLVDPVSLESISEGLKRLAADAGLRKELARRGRERASGFSWRRTAEQTLEVYRSAAD